MSHVHPLSRDDRGREHEHEHEHGHAHADRHPALTPLVIDVISDQTRAELEASIDAPLTIERGTSGAGAEPPAESNPPPEQPAPREIPARDRERESRTMNSNSTSIADEAAESATGTHVENPQNP
jgi:hypothetical protein